MMKPITLRELLSGYRGNDHINLNIANLVVFRGTVRHFKMKCRVAKLFENSCYQNLLEYNNLEVADTRMSLSGEFTTVIAFYFGTQHEKGGKNDV